MEKVTETEMYIWVCKMFYLKILMCCLLWSWHWFAYWM